MAPARGPWYISARAVRDYLALRGRAVVDDGSDWDHAAVELGRLAEQTVASGRRPKTMESGALRYRGPKPLRLGLVVMPDPRPEGDLPQLVRVLPGHAGHHGERR